MQAIWIQFILCIQRMKERGKDKNIYGFVAEVTAEKQIDQHFFDFSIKDSL